MNKLLVASRAQPDIDLRKYRGMLRAPSTITFTAYARWFIASS